MPPRESLDDVTRSLTQQAKHLRSLGLKTLPTEPPPVSRDSRRAGAPSECRRPERVEALRALEAEVIACTGCSLYRTRTRHVFGEGDVEAKLVFVGEAPGREEDLQGRPFVGAAGQLLTKMIEAIGLTREQVYICNVLKDRPPNNRLPEPVEMDACKPYLARQLAIIRPRIICTLGAIATKALLGPHVSITQVRGTMHAFEEIPLIPTFHPAYLLRNPPAKKFVWQDLKKIKRLLDERE